ncbi:NAD(P)/FAD-dependent oxidoreductase [Martelella soudanensis]|uniref:NAD(P)/FAD-dependent oxidoreductase n=1 Tax=unclassified Martelella TaxID=2629616 RepID=UPI0015DE2AE6|nr:MULTISPECIES: FAD-binding oxidoreductase [unclassified Martelella]
MPVPNLQRPGFSAPLPESADVVVIGGGIAGVTTALFLAEAGVNVVLCEKGTVAAEQSSRNWGWVRQMGRDPAELPLTIESLNLWRDVDRRFGIETGFRETGITYVCRTKAEIAEFTAWEKYAREAGMLSRLLDASGLQALLPGITSPYKLGLYTANDGRAEPGQAVPQMAAAAVRLGARIIENCAVRGSERSGGRISGVVTENGTIATSSVVVAAGAWSRLFLGNLGLDFPQLKLLGTAARIESDGAVPDMPVGGGDFSFRKRLDGGYTIAQRNANVAPITPDSFRLFFDFLPTLLTSWRELKLRVNGQTVSELKMPRRWSLDQVTPFEAIRMLDPVPHAPFNRNALANLARAFPAFADARLTDSWAGMIDATPDAIPVIGPIAAVPGLYLSSGFSGHGFGSGPGAGRLMAELVRNEKPCVDPAPFRYERFSKTAKAA